MKTKRKNKDNLMYWTEEGGQLVLRSLEKAAYKARLLWLIFFGLAMILGTIGYLYYKFQEGHSPWEYFFPASFSIAFGTMILLSPLFSKDSIPKEEIRFNPMEEIITFLIGEGKFQSEIVYSYGAFDSIQLVQIQNDNPASQRSHDQTYRHVIFLKKYDGSVYWIDSIQSSGDLESKLTLLRNYIQLKIVDHSDFDLGQEDCRNYSLKFENTPQRPSANLNIKLKNQSKILFFSGYFGIKDYFLLGLLYYLLICFPIWFFLYVLFNQSFFYIVSLPVVVLMVLIPGIYFLSLKRNIVLTLHPEFLSVEHKYPFPFQSLNHLETFSKEFVKFVQVHRLEMGGYWLSVVYGKPFDKTQKLTVKSFLNTFHAGNFPPIILGGEDTQLIGLWLFAHKIQPSYPSFEDLFYIEKLIQDTLGITER